MTRDFRWMPHAGRRHAIRRQLTPRDAGETLCGVPLIIPADQPYAHWCWPTCPACDSAWRAHEGIGPPRRPARRPGETAACAQ
ncbi:zinc finger protein [Saccharothrix obliqua]|uniref:zinc finger protein n=1 Tax=Saccharothrix obliqua TaxID=2861747 RepID=UPI001C5EF148|nr:zinc finger protein [Saccharothrix obliqua]MBW4716920.1 hypothetical protein [Saccharothrix obliqua]